MVLGPRGGLRAFPALAAVDPGPPTALSGSECRHTGLSCHVKAGESGAFVLLACGLISISAWQLPLSEASSSARRASPVC